MLNYIKNSKDKKLILALTGAICLLLTILWTSILVLWGEAIFTLLDKLVSQKAFPNISTFIVLIFLAVCTCVVIWGIIHLKNKQIPRETRNLSGICLQPIANGTKISLKNTGFSPINTAGYIYIASHLRRKKDFLYEDSIHIQNKHITPGLHINLPYEFGYYFSYIIFATDKKTGRLSISGFNYSGQKDFISVGSNLYIDNTQKESPLPTWAYEEIYELLEGKEITIDLAIKQAKYLIETKRAPAE